MDGSTSMNARLQCIINLECHKFAAITLQAFTLQQRTWSGVQSSLPISKRSTKYAPAQELYECTGWRALFPYRRIALWLFRQHSIITLYERQSFQSHKMTTR